MTERITTIEKQYSIRIFIHLFLSFILIVLLSACAPVGPDFVKPAVEMPDQWIEQGTEGLASGSPDLTAWWHIFNDPVLNNLVETARRKNNTLEIAGLRVLEARAQLGIATGSLYPQSQLATGGGTYTSPPENTGISSNYWQYSLGASAAWEIDFWGRFRRGIESAGASFMASIAAYDQAKVLLTAQVVDSYIAVRLAEEQVRIARENIVIQQRSYDIAEVLFHNGETSELDMQQANTLLLSTKATIPNLEVQLTQARNALSILLGQQPGSVNTILEKGSGIPVIPEEITIGFPADMLRLRPDVRQAELLAMAQNALVGVAEAGLYPSFSLAGNIGLAAGEPGGSDFGDLFTGDAFTFSIGPSFVWPFLNYGRIKNSIRVQDARLQQALVNYRETVIQAAREAENAMAGFIGARRQAVILAKTVESAKRSNALATLQYKDGFTDYQRVLNSQQSLFAQDQRYITSQGAAVSNLVALFKAMGGGWEDREDVPFITSETLETMQKRTDWGDLIRTGLDASAKDNKLPVIDW